MRFQKHNEQDNDLQKNHENQHFFEPNAVVDQPYEKASSELCDNVPNAFCCHHKFFDDIVRRSEKDIEQEELPEADGEEAGVPASKVDLQSYLVLPSFLNHSVRILDVLISNL